MKKMFLFLFVFSSILLSTQHNSNSSVSIPVGGNCWVVDEIFDDHKNISEAGIINWKNPKTKFRIYFKLKTKGKLSLALVAKVNSGVSKLNCRIGNQQKAVTVDQTNFTEVYVGDFYIKKSGYKFVELEGISKEDIEFCNLKEIVISGEVTDKEIVYVKDDFYWGRRGPSVHLSYKVSREIGNVEWFYNEIRVPEGEDVIGSYFMANGFKQGYFGIQVNSEKERRVLFSVWSPYETQNPDEIPEEYRINLLKKGDNVYSGKFGNEGSGGQSYFKYNWKADVTYKFLLKGIPTGDSSTIFTAYFFIPELDEWKLIASFKRPFTDTHLTNLYSFLENFITGSGNISRYALYSNQWVRNTSGEWYELTEALFTADATARKGARVDYSGGVMGKDFFMKNCGFYNETTEIGTKFQRKSLSQKPDIDFSKLP